MTALRRVAALATTVSLMAPMLVPAGARAGAEGAGGRGARATSTLPIVFMATADPVGAGFVKSLGRPG